MAERNDATVTEWVSDQHPHKFRVDGDEVVDV